MLIESTEYIHRVDGIPLYYNGLTLHNFFTPEGSPTYSNYDSPTSYKSHFLMPKPDPQTSSPITLTPPISPVPDRRSTNTEHPRRSSVIMKVENCQILPVIEKEESRLVSIEHVCRWESCYRIFESLEKLANHVSISHSGVGMNNLYYCRWEQCSRSDRGFNARYKMLVHCRTHTKEKPHFCSYTGCSKAFSRAENLKIHMRSHNGEKPYRCSYPNCNKAYSNSSDRFKHSRTHQTNKPYVCKVQGCAKRYTDPSSLRKHVKTFNHEIISQKRISEPMECDLPSTLRHDNHRPSDDIYFNENKKCDHLESNDIYYWRTPQDDIADVRIDQPLDLSLKHNR